MKTLFLIALVTINTSLIMSQTTTEPQFSFCNGTKDKDTINSLDFDNCLDLISLDKNVAILSYRISYLMPDGIYADYPNNGSLAGKNLIADLKKLKPNKILIEEVKTTDSNGIIKKCPGLVLFVKW